jgi:spore maturation protein CgeB
LEEPRLRGLLARHPSPPVEYLYELGFNSLPGHRYGLRRLVKQPHYPARLVYPIYLALLRRIRRSGFRMWQQRVLQQGIAVVNLPHLVKGYSGRVIEGMAAGRPVISWEIPDRPYNTALFADGKEILLYNTPAQLADHIAHLRAEPAFGAAIAANARRQVQAWHTTEKRVQQILRWVATGATPSPLAVC